MKRLIFLLIFLLVSALIHAQEIPAEDQIVDLVDAMEAAVLAGDADLYLSYVDLSEANFAVEHTNWANDWAEGEYLTDFAFEITEIEVERRGATGLLSIDYTTTLEENPGMSIQIPVRFSYDSENEQWLFAGEDWVSRDIFYFQIHAAPGLEDVVQSLVLQLPSIYQRVANTYGHFPDAQMQIKLYRSREELSTMTLLSLPAISGWNEPNESLKSIGTNPDALPGIVAHEFTHFLTFDQAGQTHGMMPWWLAEGIATYLAQSFDGRGDDRYTDWLTTAIGWLRTRQFMAWEDLADYESVPVEQWGFAYIQGYTFVYYVTETYGERLRNDWLHAMAEEDIDTATEAVFEMPFEELDQLFKVWLWSYKPEE